MTSKEFWEDDPNLFSSYRFYFNKKQKDDLENANYIAWLQGLYIYDGSNKTMVDFGYNFLAGKKNPNKDTYTKEPYDIFNEKEEKEKLKAKQKKQDYENTLMYYGSLKQIYLDKLKRKE